MKLIFDLTKTQPLGGSKFHGGGKYGEIIFKALIEKSQDVIGYYNSNKWINPTVVAICEKNNILMVDSNDKSLSQVAEAYGGMIYSPLIGKELNNLSDNVIYVATLHGLRSLEMPSDKYKGTLKNLRWGWFYNLYYQLKRKWEFKAEFEKHKRLFAKSNIRLVTVSEHSKASILSFFPEMVENNIRVYYSPSTVDTVSLAFKAKETKEKYYLLVSGHRWVKNTIRAVQAFDELFSERLDFEGKVVITGVQDRRYFDRFIKNKDRFEFLSYVDDNQLADLYRNAYLFVYPSLNEGFGYPPLEAMAQGTPIISSAIASIPEICGDSVLYFNPFLISEIKMRVIQMEDSAYRDEYIQRSKSQFERIKMKQDRDLSAFVDYLLSF